jgi:molybdate/tungstate transport system substrate-binding protein
MPTNRVLAVLVLLLSACGGNRRASGDGVSGTLVVYNAGSLALPFQQLLTAFAARHPGVTPAQESSGSLEAARKLTELGKIPDVLAVADYNVITKLLIPGYASDYVPFASNAMVLAYTERSREAETINGENWWRILLEPGVRWGHSNPALDPNGYRTLMVFQLAEQHYRQSGLADRLERALDPRYVRAAEAQLVGLLQAGELDYGWSYRSLAASTGLKWVNLPAEIDLSDPTKADWYARASVRLPGPRRAGDSVEFRGEPILYALTIPNAAPHPEIARAFVEFVQSSEGAAILTRLGFTLSSPSGAPR